MQPTMKRCPCRAHTRWSLRMKRPWPPRPLTRWPKRAMMMRWPCSSSSVTLRRWCRTYQTCSQHWFRIKKPARESVTGDDQEGWPSKNRSKGQGKDFQSGGRYGRKGGQKGGKEELLSRISRTHCKLCGVMGHWKAECPQRREQAREQANVVQPDGHHDDDLPQVIVEEMDEAQSVTCHAAECFHAPDFSNHPKQNSKGIPEPVRVQAVQFLSRRMSSHWLKW